jgi:predicted lipoprotein with Yx(FWY)xxD motif
MRNPRIAIAAVVVAAAATIGGVTAAASGSSTNANAPASGTAMSSATSARDLVTLTAVHATKATVQGKSENILVDADGLPLYTYRGDTPTTSHVTGQLAALWPPLLGNPSDVRATHSALTSVTTANGNQVAYHGHFLYTFVEDSPGHVTGQGVQNFFVATPALTAGASGTTQPAPAMPSNSYGY